MVRRETPTARAMAVSVWPRSISWRARCWRGGRDGRGVAGRSSISKVGSFGKFWEMGADGCGWVEVGDWAQAGRAPGAVIGIAVADIVSSFSSLWAVGEGRVSPSRAAHWRNWHRPRERRTEGILYQSVSVLSRGGALRSPGAGWWKGGVRYNAGAERGMEVRSEGERMEGQGDGAAARRSVRWRRT